MPAKKLSPMAAKLREKALSYDFIDESFRAVAPKRVLAQLDE